MYKFTYLVTVYNVTNHSEYLAREEFKMTIDYTKQANSDIALIQNGSAGANRAAFVVGARSGRPDVFEAEDVRRALAVNSSDQVGYWTHFVGGIGGTGYPLWSVTAATGTASVLAATANGVWRLSATAVINDFVCVGLGVHWLVSAGFHYFTAKVRIPTITLIKAEVGVSDALTETAGLAFSNHSVAGVTDVATDAAIFAFDTTASSANWLINYVKAGTPGAIDTDIPVVAGQWYELGIVVDENGNVWFYIDGNLVGTAELAVDTTALLTPWATVLATTAAIRTLDLDFVGITGASS